MAAKPLLASEVLRDEVAPLEPGRRAARLWLAGAALTVAVSTWLLGLDTATGLAIAAGLAALGVMRLSYALRAALMVAAASVLVFLGHRGSGPLAGTLLAPPEPWRLIAAVGVSCAIWFRGHYRRYWAAHALFALGMLLSVPYAWHQGETVLGGPDLLARAAAASGLVAVALAPLALIPQLSSWTLAYLALAAIGLELGGAGGATALNPALARVFAYLAVASLGSLGLFQMFAWASASRARSGLRVSPEDEELEQRISVG